MLAIEALTEIFIGIRVGHLVEIGIQDLLVDHLVDIETTEEIEIGIKIEIGTIEEIEVHQVMVMIIQDPEVAEKLGIILI